MSLDLILLLFLVAVYAIVFVVKSLGSKSVDVKGTPIGSEVFPKIEIFNNNKNDYEDSLNSSSVTTNRKTVAEPAKNSVQRMNYKEIVENYDAAHEKSKKTGVSLRSRSEAKRAFIHSEILKRKY